MTKIGIFRTLTILSILDIASSAILFLYFLIGGVFTISDSPSYRPTTPSFITIMFWGGLIVLVVNLIWYYFAQDKKIEQTAATSETKKL